MAEDLTKKVEQAQRF
jgi:26S proteasome regulatory subunit N6